MSVCDDEWVDRIKRGEDPRNVAVWFFAKVAESLGKDQEDLSLREGEDADMSALERIFWDAIMLHWTRWCEERERQEVGETKH
jgi:hypothetical protein